MQWLRLYHDTINDPKWRVVSVRSKQPVGNVLAVWMQMLVCASEATERGTLEGWDDETSAAILGYDPEAVAAIRDAMQGRVLDGLHLTGWDKRQRQGSDDAAERQRRSRAAKQQNPPPGGGHGLNGAEHHVNGSVTGQSRDNEDMSRDNEPMSRDGNVTPSRALQTEDLHTGDYIPPVDPVEPSPALRAGGGSVGYVGKSFNLSAQTVEEYRQTYHAIPDLTAALRMLDADLVGKPEKQVYGALRARLHGMHQKYLEARVAKKPKTPNRAGVRKLGGRNAA